MYKYLSWFHKATSAPNQRLVETVWNIFALEGPSDIEETTDVPYIVFLCNSKVSYVFNHRRSVGPYVSNVMFFNHRKSVAPPM